MRNEHLERKKEGMDKVMVDLVCFFSPINEAIAAGNWRQWANDVEKILNQSGSPALRPAPHRDARLRFSIHELVLAKTMKLYLKFKAHLSCSNTLPRQIVQLSSQLR